MKNSHPNLVFVFADQMRAFACGYRRQDPVLTPHLDRFACQGTTLTHAYSNYPVCSPFRAMLMTGMYPCNNGVIHNCNSRSGIELRLNDICLTDVLSGQGYSVGYLGKWHLESPHEPFVVQPYEGVVWNEYTPPHRRHGIGYWHAYNADDRHLTPEYWIGDAPRGQRKRFEQWSPEHEADVAIEFIRNTEGGYRKSNVPFALFISNNPPHTPFNKVPRRYTEPYADATIQELLNRPNVDHNSPDPASQKARQSVRDYYAMVSGVDEQFGRILDEIDRAGIADNTLVVFTSDHGEMLGSHRLMHKDVWYDEATRIPFIVRWPGVVKAGYSVNTFLSAPDIMPTLLGLLGLKKHIPHSVQGCELSGILRSESIENKPCEAIYFRSRPGKPELRGLRTHEYLYVTGCDTKPVLYDMLQDPYQQRNIAFERSQLAMDMHQRLLTLLHHINDTSQTSLMQSQ